MGQPGGRIIRAGTDRRCLCARGESGMENLERKQPDVKKPYDAVFPDLHWRVQDIVNAVASSGLRITEMAELPAVDASFWFSYDEMKTKTEEETKDLNDWTRNPMAAIPAWLALISQKQ